MIRDFVDRESELRLLEEEWEKPGGRMIILYGRRRIGKTRLIGEFIRDKPGVLYFAEDTSPSLQMRQLQAACAAFLNDSLMASLEIGSWEQLFTYLAKHPPDSRGYLVIDEFTYLAKNDPSILSALQKTWDTDLAGSPWCILLCGSMLGLMSDLALSSTSPIYGRRTRDMLLEALQFSDARQFLSVPPIDALKIYLSIGGVPEYLLKAGDYETFSDFTTREFFNRYGYFYREPYFILSQEFRELKMYQSILQAIAYGNTSPAPIAQFCGLDSRHLYPYLESMIRLGIIERELPVLVNTRKGVYRIKDRLFNFWYNFVFPKRQSIELNQVSIPAEDYDHYFGPQFEVFVRSEVIPKLFPEYTIGRWWYGEEEIDIVGYDDRSGTILFGECKWSVLTRNESQKILASLKTKSSHVRHSRYTEEKFLLVARKIEGKEALRKEGYVLLDLDDIL
ncbi:MAG TPA: ATP-binding protein [Methanoregulaceae archaeon]|nr:ATP-binding protein [Methanoregulaceae archaeon]HQJ87949.1 ATP-binding protein [Methanoregulaceae archaeon]